MFKQKLLACAVFSLLSHFAFAAPAASESPKEAKPSPAPVQAANAPTPAPVPVPAAEEAKPGTKPVAKRKAKWSNANIDLTPCLERNSNEAVIRCAE